VSLLTLYQQLQHDLQASKLHSLYLFYGAEEWLVQAATQLVSRQVLQGIDEALLTLNKVELDGRSVEPARLAQEMLTPPFFAPHKLIVVNNAPYFAPKRKQNDAEDEQPADTPIAAQLAEAFKNPTPGVITVFQAEMANLRMTLSTLIKKHGAVYNFTYAKRAEVMQDAQAILRKWVQDKKMSMDAAAQQRLLGLVVSDEKTPYLRTLQSELDKLIAYKGYSGAISVNDVDLLVTRSAEAKVFDVTDGLSQRDARKALAHLQELWQDGEEPFMVLGMLSRHFRQLLIVKELLHSGLSEQETIAQIGGHPFVAGKTIQAAKQFGLSELKEHVHRCYEIDYAAKTGQGDAVLAMEMLIVSSCK